MNRYGYPTAVGIVRLNGEVIVDDPEFARKFWKEKAPKKNLDGSVVVDDFFTKEDRKALKQKFKDELKDLEE